jgi:hypothetical protein
MKNIAFLASAAILAATPVSLGLIGNASFSEDVPVRVPATATLLDDHGHAVSQQHRRHEAEAGDDHGGQRRQRAA